MIFFHIVAASGNIRGGISSVSAENTDANLVFDGNSLTQGTGATSAQDYPNMVKNNFTGIFKSVEFHSFGVGGQTLDQMLADKDTQILPLVNTAKLNILVLWEDVNQLFGGGGFIRGRTHFNKMKNYAQEAKSAGFDKVIVLTSYYFKKDADGIFRNVAGTDVSYVEDIDDASDTLAVYFDLVKNLANTDAPWDYSIDLRDSPNIGGGRSEIKDNTYFSDFIHLKTPGYQIVANEVNAIVDQIITNLTNDVIYEAAITTPRHGVLKATGSTISITALLNSSATSPNTTKVEYYNGIIKLGEKTAAPFNTFDWDSTGFTGELSLTAKWFVDGVEVDATPIVTGSILTEQLPTPTNMRFTSITSSSFYIRFDGQIGTNYRTYMEASLQSDFSTIAWDYNTGANSMNFQGVSPLTTYYMRVKTVTNDQTIADSEWLVDEITTLA